MKKQQSEVLKIALRLISQRDRTEAELREKLERKGFPKEIIVEVITHLKQKGFINDSKFIQKAEKIAEDRFLGEIGLYNYLMRRGIDKELLEFLPQIDEFSLASKLLQKKEHLMKNTSADKRKAKIVGFLLRRGFSWDTINKCLKSVEKGGKFK